jgi:hypothetical protein
LLLSVKLVSRTHGLTGIPDRFRDRPGQLARLNTSRTLINPAMASGCVTSRRVSKIPVAATRRGA